jgi:hypothetical protein
MSNPGRTRYNGGTTVADDSVNPLVRQINERLPWLFSDNGFKIVDYSYDARSFGNCVVTLESETLRLRFHMDRGIGYAELASQTDPEYWFDLALLLRPILGERPDPNFEGVALLLKDNFPALVTALGPKFPETKREEERRKDELAAQWKFKRFKPVPFKFSYGSGSTAFNQSVAGNVLYVLLRALEVGIVFWALYKVFR